MLEGRTKNIMLIFLNFIYVLGIILTIVGFIQGLQTLAYSLLLDKYPANMYEDNCSRVNYPKPVDPPAVEKESQQDLADQKQECLSGLERQRKIKQINDATRSVGFLVAGVVLILLFNPKSRLVLSYSQNKD
jgi:hypothetical protein